MSEKKRWMPKEGEKFYFISSGGVICEDTWSECYREDQMKRRNFLGVYPFHNHKQDEEMLDKIKAFVSAEIGES